ncbi:hypothetical protein GQX74_005264 [Glossina fuscipes]|nr:hypothetical protein GQX74_005264 [Glossina fuscipes]
MGIFPKEKLLEKYFNGNTEEFFKCAHVINPLNKSSNTNRPKNCENPPPGAREICFFHLSSDSMTGLECSHRFCLTYWREYLTTKIVTEGLAQSISCAAHGCDILVDNVTGTKLVHDPRVGIKYQELINNVFAERNYCVGARPMIAFMPLKYLMSNRILHMHIASIEKLPLTTTGSPLLIRCKTFLSVTFVIPKDSECHDVYMSLVKLYQPVSINKLYCFNYQPVKDDLPKSAGWDFFKLEHEFKRMRVPNDIWTLCSLNANYELCDTYPRQIYVPQEANTAMLIGSSRFRSKGRLPALTYLHSNKIF